MGYIMRSDTGNWIDSVENAVREALASEASGHDVEHAFRVRNLALRLAGPSGADAEVVEATALLHDIGHVVGREDHAANGASFARELLAGSGFPTEKIAAVVLCIQRHHWMAANAGDPANPSVEYQVFADADRLDALGAIGIARTFAFGGAHGRPIWTTADGAGPDAAYGRSSVHHFFDKLLHLEAGMYTAAARRLAARRSTILKGFLKSFLDEWDLRDLETPVLSSSRTDDHVQDDFAPGYQDSRSGS